MMKRMHQTINHKVALLAVLALGLSAAASADDHRGHRYRNDTRDHRAAPEHRRSDGRETRGHHDRYRRTHRHRDRHYRSRHHDWYGGRHARGYRHGHGHRNQRHHRRAHRHYHGDRICYSQHRYPLRDSRYYSDSGFTIWFDGIGFTYSEPLYD